MISNKSILIKYWKSLLWAVIMAYLLFSPGSGLPKVNFIHIKHFDKLVHFLLFFNLQLLLLYDNGVRLPELSLRKIVQFSALALLYGGFSEIIQYVFVSGRQGSVYDFMADFLGCTSAYGIFLLAGNTINRFPRLKL